MITWKKSGRCTSGMCVEIAKVDGLWHYRQTDNPSDVIQYTADQHKAITDEILDQAPHGSSGYIEWHDDGGMTLREGGGQPEPALVYDDAEVAAYRDGLANNDFQPVPTLTPPEAN